MGKNSITEYHQRNWKTRILNRTVDQWQQILEYRLKYTRMKIQCRSKFLYVLKVVQN